MWRNVVNAPGPHQGFERIATALRWAVGILSDVGNDAVRWGVEKLHGLSFLMERRQVLLEALHRLVRVLQIRLIRVHLGFEGVSLSRFDLLSSSSSGSGRPI
jgi:hypothetical protein